MTTLRTFTFASTVLLAAGGAGQAAFADEPAVDTEGGVLFGKRLPAVTQALEISAGGGYTQGFGDIGQGQSAVDDLTKVGGTGELRVGYRVTPHLTLGAYGSYNQFQQGDKLLMTGVVRGATAGLHADWHFLPDRQADPWFSLSSGWRGLWLVPDEGKNTAFQGWDVAQLKFGIDYRITPEVALGPFVGAGLSIFLTKDAPNQTGYQDIQDPKANMFVFAGLQARFDVFGTRVK